MDFLSGRNFLINGVYNYKEQITNADGWRVVFLNFFKDEVTTPFAIKIVEQYPEHKQKIPAKAPKTYRVLKGTPTTSKLHQYASAAYIGHINVQSVDWMRHIMDIDKSLIFDIKKEFRGTVYVINVENVKEAFPDDHKVVAYLGMFLNENDFSNPHFLFTTSKGNTDV